MPTKAKLRYLAPAVTDLEEIVKYHIAQVGVTSAKKIYTLMDTTIQKLEDFPLLGQIHPDPLLAQQGYRKLVLNPTYVAIYRIIDGTVFIYRIVNGKTDYRVQYASACAVSLCKRVASRSFRRRTKLGFG
jgi:addiction module RelE/StbE family toxin